ncbi:MAG: hypothetical protein R3A44_00060 [Caldilineaceae bacterium]
MSTPRSCNAYLIPASATQNLGEGNHTVQVRAADNVGLSSSSQVSAAAVQTVQVDTTAPNPKPKRPTCPIN